METQTIVFDPPSEAPPVLILPVPERIFAERAERLQTLAHEHSLGDWLRFISRLTQAQHDALHSLGEFPLPEASFVDQAQRHGMPPLNAMAQIRPAIWHEVLQHIVDALIPHSPAAAVARLRALRSTPTEQLERMADALLGELPDPENLPDLPFVAAALQVVWTVWAARLDASTFIPLDTPEVCPCCGSLPVASIVRMSSTVNNLRYLHCSLCNSQWNVPRATCTACNTDKAVSYQKIDGSDGAVRAECCDDCKSYLKIMVQEKDFKVDPVADDLATLALDMLVDEAGYARSGPNLLLLGGGA